MGGKIQALIKGIQESSANLNQQSHGVKTASLETQSSSEQVAASIQQISAGAKQIEYDISNISETIQDISKSSQQVSVNVQSVDNYANEVAELVGKGEKAAAETIEKSNSVRNKLDITVEKVNQLYKASDKIGGILKIIQDISEQTNLLALNAAIEAARAGENGRGFAVVAEEVRKLASESNESTGNIQKLIQDIQNGVREIVTEIKGSQSETNEMLITVTHTEEAVQDISKAAVKMKQQLSDITVATQELASGHQQIVDASMNTVSIVEEAKAATHEVSASAEEQNATMQELGAMCNELQNLADQLNELVQKFTV
ncbi:methyl-accepting chemotaxis protein [Bacillus carboniphilus]